jgi:hypothetical protein
MKILSLPTIKQFQLNSDPDKEAWVEFRQGTFGEAKERQEIRSRARFIRTDGRGNETAVEQDFNELEAMALDIYLTLSGAGGFVNEDGEEMQLFKFRERNGVTRVSGSKEDFFVALNKLPERMVREMHRHCMSVNKQWDGFAEGE